MEIRALSLRVTEEELNGWIGRLIDGRDKIHRLRVEIRADGLLVDGQGEFMGQTVPFDATVEVYAQGGTVSLRLTRFEAAGFFPLPAWWILKKLQRHEREWLRVESDTVVLNAEHLLEERGISLAMNLAGVRCEPGALFLESLAPEADDEAVEAPEAVGAAAS